MNEKKKTLALLFVLAVCLGVVLVPRGYPDWALNVMQREGTTFVVTGSVDANITNTEINAYVTNSTITIEPSSTAVFEVKPSAEVVFNIQGSVDANITNTELDVHVTNSTITIEPEEAAEFIIKPATGVVFQIQGDVNITNTELNVNVTNSTLNITGDVNATIQGTASVSIDYATITVDVATIREKASAENKLGYETGYASAAAGDAEWFTLFTNNLGETVYIETITFAVLRSPVATAPIHPLEAMIHIKLYDASNNVFAEFYQNGYSPELNFDPAVPLPANGYIKIGFINRGDSPAELFTSVVYRKG